MVSPEARRGTAARGDAAPLAFDDDMATDHSDALANYRRKLAEVKEYL
ncbi:hypothetical protein [Euzebya sp.]